jgi:hypothetical protein
MPLLFPHRLFPRHERRASKRSGPGLPDFMSKDLPSLWAVLPHRITCTQLKLYFKELLLIYRLFRALELYF